MRTIIKRNIAWLIFAITAAILLVCDIWLKIWIAAHWNNLEDDRVLIKGILGLTYRKNTGAAFSFLADFNGARWVLSILVAITLAAILWYYSRLPDKSIFWFIRVPVIFIFTGGLGNLIDRISLGYVRDMLEFLFFDFPIFNLADAYVTCGVFALVFVGIFIVKDFPFP